MFTKWFNNTDERYLQERNSFHALHLPKHLYIVALTEAYGSNNSTSRIADFSSSINQSINQSITK